LTNTSIDSVIITN